MYLTNICDHMQTCTENATACCLTDYNIKGNAQQAVMSRLIQVPSKMAEEEPRLRAAELTNPCVRLQLLTEC